MKKAVFLMIAILYSLNCLGQHEVALSDAVHINLSDGAEKITKQQALSLAGKKFNNDKMALIDFSKGDSSHIYKVDDIFISLHTENINVKEGHLLELWKGFDELFKGNTTYTSSLKKVNNNSVLVINYIMGNRAYYRFFGHNANNSKSISGVLEFDKADANKAKAVLDELLNSITFTE